MLLLYRSTLPRDVEMIHVHWLFAISVKKLHIDVRIKYSHAVVFLSSESRVISWWKNRPFGGQTSSTHSIVIHSSSGGPGGFHRGTVDR